jgi:hypothetical protein
MEHRLSTKWRIVAGIPAGLLGLVWLSTAHAADARLDQAAVHVTRAASSLKAAQKAPKNPDPGNHRKKAIAFLKHAENEIQAAKKASTKLAGAQKPKQARGKQPQKATGKTPPAARKAQGPKATPAPKAGLSKRPATKAPSSNKSDGKPEPASRQR